ncbi:MAG: MAPEG family protein [Pseudomonadota bacterium]|nr:MAPEG family protein [Pseudomonadota bacterium]
MTIAYWCVLIAAFLPFVFTGVAKFSGKGFNNRTPRAFQDRLDGFRQRAHWAHLNSFEAFPPFAAAVIIAHQLQYAQGRIDQLAIAFIVLRLIYGALYIADQASLRSVVWLGAVVCWVAMFFIGR